MLSVKFKMDDSDVQARIRATERRSRNLRRWFNNVADDLAALHRINYSTNGSLVGGWAPLSEATMRRKARLPGQFRHKMVRSGDLRDSVVGRPFAIERINLMSMVYGTDVAYAKFHQRGTRHMPARRVLFIPEAPVHKWKITLAAYILHGRLAT